jgi:hypothetical protein
MKVAKFKADEIHKSKVFLHGSETAKKEALNSAKAIKALAPFEEQEFWSNVISEIEKKHA